MSSPIHTFPSSPPRTPTRTPSFARRGIYAINPPGYHSPTMALNAEPADPLERKEQHLPMKSYADAAEEALEHNGNGAIDEDSIKETPPRPSHQRVPSTPRPLGEVIDENEKAVPPGSPTLRHKNARIEKDAHKETYAQAVKEHEPTKTQTPPSEMQTNGKLSEQLPDGNGPNGAPVSYSGVGIDETPRSPIRDRKAHKRVSSRSLNGTAQKQAQAEKAHPNGSADVKQNSTNGSTSDKDTGATEESTIVQEKYRSKSGQALTSVEVGDDFGASLKQRENKQFTTEASAQPARRRQNSELVSGRRAGAGWSESAIRWAPMNVPLQRRLQTLMVLLHTLSIAGGLALFFLLCTIPLLWPILVPYLLYVLMSSAGTSGELSHRSEWLRSSKVWSLFASYFPARLHRTTKLEPTRKYIFGYHPHGIISHGAFAAFATEALGFGQLFPGITNTLLTLDSNFRIPLYRDYALRMGLASVSRESCENILSKGGKNGEGMGRAITIVVGGARESLDAKPGSLKLVLKRRKGFVKLAIRQGADLVPCIAFGENDLYDQFDSNSHPYVHRAQLLVKKFMGFTVPLFHARGMYSL